MSLPTLATDSYGVATTALQQVLSAASGFRPFPVRSPPQPSPEAQAAVKGHLDRLTELFPDRPRLNTLPLRWLDGDLAAFDSLSPATDDTDGWGDPFGPTTWGRLLGELAQDVKSAILRTPDLLALVQPPLWPAPRLLNVVGTAIFDSPPAAEFQPEPRWALLSHIDYNYHRTLSWALALPQSLQTSPFYHLFQAHLAGSYPLGIIEETFVVFTRTA